MKKYNKKALYIIALYCNIVRFYDYGLFGLSASILAKEFMPELQFYGKLLNFFALLPITMLARPVGSIIFGTIADKLGRESSTRISTILSTISTFLIAIIPSYSVIGHLSLVLLLLCRVLFVISLAGEIDTIKIHITEKFHKKSYIVAGVLSLTSQIGVLFASCMYNLSSRYINDPEYFYIWRLNFLLGSSLGFMIILVRRFFPYKSSSSIECITQINNYKQFFHLLKKFRHNVISSILINGSIGGIYHFFIIFLPTFIISLGFVKFRAANTYFIMLYTVACILSGYYSTNNSKKSINISLMISIFITLNIFFYHILSNLQFNTLLIYISGALIFLAPFYTIPLYVKQQKSFKKSARGRLYSFAHSIGSLTLSSTTPLICTAFWYYTRIDIIIFLPLLIFFTILLYLSKSKQITEIK